MKSATALLSVLALMGYVAATVHPTKSTAKATSHLRSTDSVYRQGYQPPPLHQLMLREKGASNGGDSVYRPGYRPGYQPSSREQLMLQEKGEPTASNGVISRPPDSQCCLKNPFM